MAGLVPAIHDFIRRAFSDAGPKAGHDDESSLRYPLSTQSVGGASLLRQRWQRGLGFYFHHWMSLRLAPFGE
jgi:hypothetical protein